MNDKSKIIKLKDQFKMYSGGYLESPLIAYETWGELSLNRDNAVIIFTGLSPSAHAASSQENPSPGWWEGMIGPGKPLDTDHYFVICVNSLGSCFGSTGPSSINPMTNDYYRTSFPLLTLEDIAICGFKVLEALEINTVCGTIGCSMGGMTALAFCALYPEVTERLLVISSAMSATPFSIAVRSLQREMIIRDPKWDNGNYEINNPPIDGQRLARKLGMMTYRSPEEWDQRFARTSSRSNDESSEKNKFFDYFSVESYLQNHANKFTGQFDANCYLYLSRASDLFDFSNHGSSLDVAFNSLGIRESMIIGVETDILFPIWQQIELAERLEQVTEKTEFVKLNCIKGHDSFLVDLDVFGPVVKRFFSFR